MSKRYEIIFLPAAEKSFDRLARSDRKLAQRFDYRFQELSEHPYPAEVVIIKRARQYDLCRVKVGQSWRIIYAVLQDKIVVLVADITSRQSANGNIEVLLSRVETFIAALGRDIEE
jgi:mRNA-degrading endonuclease RelE of RelBE toxin-antitoxin system